MLKYVTPDFIYKSVYDIDFDALKKEHNISGVIFDIDNTLVSYKQPEPTAKVIDLMKSLREKNFSVCFISNNTKSRVDIFNGSFEYLAFSNAGKPSVKAFKEAEKKMNIKRGSIAVIGDQLFTDVIAARRMGMTSILVSPIEPVETLFFKIKRAGEKPFIRRYYKKFGKAGK